VHAPKAGEKRGPSVQPKIAGVQQGGKRNQCQEITGVESLGIEKIRHHREEKARKSEKRRFNKQFGQMVDGGGKVGTGRES